MADLKARMADLPGIGSMTMNMDAGSMIYTLNGQNFTFDASASDAVIESTIRAGLTSATPTDATPAPATVPLQDTVPATASTIAPVAVPLVTPAPAVASAPVLAAHTVKGMIEAHKNSSGTMHDAKVGALAMVMQRQNDMVSAAIDGLISKVEQQTQDFQDVMKDLTNQFGDL